MFEDLFDRVKRIESEKEDKHIYTCCGCNIKYYCVFAYDEFNLDGKCSREGK